MSVIKDSLTSNAEIQISPLLAASSAGPFQIRGTEGWRLSPARACSWKAGNDAHPWLIHLFPNLLQGAYNPAILKKGSLSATGLCLSPSFPQRLNVTGSSFSSFRSCLAPRPTLSSVSSGILEALPGTLCCVLQSV